MTQPRSDPAVRASPLESLIGCGMHRDNLPGDRNTMTGDHDDADLITIRDLQVLAAIHRPDSISYLQNWGREPLDAPEYLAGGGWRGVHNRFFDFVIMQCVERAPNAPVKGRD